MNAITLPPFLAKVTTGAVGSLAVVDVTQMVMLVLAIGGLTLVMLSTRRRIRESQRSSRTSSRREQEARATRDIEQVMLELDQLSRQVHGRLDTKLAKLEAVIRDADQRIDRLSRLNRADSGPALEITLDQEDPRCPSSVEPDNRHVAIYRLADAGKSAAQIAQDVGQHVGEIELILALRRTSQGSKTA